MHRFVSLIVITLVVGLAGSAVGKTIHVKIGGTGDGSSWGNAYGSLQTALDDAEPNDSIWVGEGTYKPNNEVGGTGDRYKTFQMKNYVRIYGGFPSTGDPNWEERDWQEYETVLSGDLLGNDVEVGDPCDLIEDPCRADNCYHVLRGIDLDTNAVLDGFTITGGHADGSYPNNSGGGMYNYTGKTSLLITEIGTADPHFIEIQNVNSTSEDTSGWIVLVNDTSFGIYAVNSICWSLPSSVSAGQVLYRTDNPGDNYWGSNIDWDTAGPGWAMIVDGSGNIRDFMVWGYNKAEIASLNIDFGGFVNISVGSAWSGDGSPANHSGDYSFKRVGTSDNDSAIDFVLTTPHSKGEENEGLSTPFSGGPTVSNCTFSGNSADDGGGMYNQGSSPTITNCTFNENSSRSGGGMFNNENSNVTVTNCTLSGNQASGAGGGMLNTRSDPTVIHCIFIKNEAGMGGGGMNNYQSNPTITNCTFSVNSSIGGGGMFNYENCYPTVIQCAFVGNSAEDGGGIINVSFSEPELINCIFWDNSGGQIRNYSNSSVTVTYSDIQGGWEGTGNIDPDPLFIDPNGPDNIPGTTDDNLHLLPYSPCIDAGDPAGDYTNQTDIDGQQRVLYDNVDIGADEVFPIAGDIDQDGDVDFDDFAYFCGHWLKGK